MTRRSNVPTLEELKSRRDHIAEIVKKLDNNTLSALRRRAGASNRALEAGAGSSVTDAYATRGGSERVSGGNTRRPTETTAIAELTHPNHEGDPVRILCEEILAHMVEAHGALAAMKQKYELIVDLEDELKGRKSTVGSCRRCSRTVPGTPDDRIRSGYCEACYRAWLRAGRPERQQFERDYQPDPDGDVESEAS